MFPYSQIVEHLTASLIQTPWESVKMFDQSDPGTRALQVMNEGSFDYAPVTDEDRVVGRVRRVRIAESPEAELSTFVEPLSDDYLISADSPIPAVMRWLEHDEWLIVVGGRRFSGLITPSDLNRQGSRAYLYLLIADFEIRLAEVIREVFEDEGAAVSSLDADARNRIEGRMRRYAERDVNSDAVAAMDLKDLLALAHTSASVRRRFDSVTSSDWEWAASELVAYRNAIMHLTVPVLDDRNGLSGLVELETRLSRMAGVQ